MVKFFGDIDSSEINSSLNTVFGAAIGAYLGVVLPNAKSDIVSFNKLTYVFGGLALIVLLLQILSRTSIYRNFAEFLTITVLGLIFYYSVLQQQIENLNLNTVFLDATIISWFLSVWMFSSWETRPLKTEKVKSD